MARKLPRKDVVVVGLGWTGSILSYELANEGLDVVAIERGPWRDTPTDFPPTYDQDELRYRIRHELFLRPAQLTFTLPQQFEPDRAADPKLGRVHAAERRWRRRGALERGNLALPPERLRAEDPSRRALWREVHSAGLHHSGLGRDLRRPRAPLRPIRISLRDIGHGGKLEGPDPGRRQSLRRAAFEALSYARAASTFQPYALWRGGARNLATSLFRSPPETFRRPTPILGACKLGPCTYCGFCEWFGCGNYSKASPQTTVLPALILKNNFKAFDNSEVTRINVDGSGKRATGVTFVDTSGEEWEQPADLVILSAYTIFNVQLLLHSGIGKPYDPVKNEGVIGRNYTHQTISDVVGFFDKDKYIFNPFVASGAIGMCIDEFNGDNFDHGPLGFIGGGYMGQVQTNGRPIGLSENVAEGVPSWGAKWKQFIRDHYQSTVVPGTGVHGSFYSYRDIYLDLDPTYKDRFGRPLVRITMDFHENELKMNAYLTDKFAEIIKQMGAREVVEEAAQRALRHHRVSDNAPLRRRDHGHRSEDQRHESLLPELGRAEPVCDGG